MYPNQGNYLTKGYLDIISQDFRDHKEQWKQYNGLTSMVTIKTLGGAIYCEVWGDFDGELWI